MIDDASIEVRSIVELVHLTDKDTIKWKREKIEEYSFRLVSSYVYKKFRIRKYMDYSTKQFLYRLLKRKTLLSWNTGELNMPQSLLSVLVKSIERQEIRIAMKGIIK